MRLEINYREKTAKIQIPKKKKKKPNALNLSKHYMLRQSPTLTVALLHVLKFRHLVLLDF